MMVTVDAGGITEQLSEGAGAPVHRLVRLRDAAKRGVHLASQLMLIFAVVERVNPPQMRGAIV